MNHYRCLKEWLSLFLLLIFVGGYLALPLPKNEFFPFYSWSMFALVPQTQIKFALRVYEFHSKILEPPLFYEEAWNIVPHSNSITAQMIIQELGKAQESQQISLCNQLRRLLETKFLPPPCRYELVKIEYHPLDRWKTGKVDIRAIFMYTGGDFLP